MPGGLRLSHRQHPAFRCTRRVSALGAEGSRADRRAPRAWQLWLAVSRCLGEDLLQEIPVPKLWLPNRLNWVRYAVLTVSIGLVPLVTRDLRFRKLCLGARGSVAPADRSMDAGRAGASATCDPRLRADPPGP